MSVVTEPTKVLVGLALTGSTRPLDVARLTLPEQLRGPTVANGTRLKRETRFVVTDTDDPSEEAQTELLSHALGCRPGDALSAPVPEWADHLAPVSSPTATRTVAVGLVVNERWSTSYGDVALEYQVSAGARDATCPAFDTGNGLSKLEVDRSRHLVESTQQCDYCSEHTCSRCSDAVATCVVCHTQACGRCVERGGSVPLCLACMALQLAGRLASRRKAGKGGKILNGEDRLHRVGVVLAADGSCTVEVVRGSGVEAKEPTAAGLEFVRSLVTAKAR